jgi:hypothetical protein
MNDDIRRQLEDAGRRDTPEPPEAFVRSLGARLLTQAQETPPVTSAPSGPVRGWSIARLTAGLAAVVLASFVALTIFVGGQRTGSLELIDPVHVVVVLADGTRLVDPDGLLIPDGAVIEVGVDGSARIGDSILVAGDRATVDARRLRVDPRGSFAAVPPGSATAFVAPSAARTQTPSPSAVEPTETPSRTGSASTPTPTPRSTGTPTPRSDPSPTPSPATDAKLLKLRARNGGPAEVLAAWNRVPGARRYLLIGSGSRHGPAVDPTYPGSRVIARFARRPDFPLSFTVNEAVVEIRLQVIALGVDGVVLDRSNIVRVRFDDLAGDPASSGDPGSDETDGASPSPTAGPSSLRTRR